MDSQQFDQITGSFAQARTRRSALRLFGLAAIGSLGLSLANDTDARRRRKRGKKSSDSGSGNQNGSRKQLGEICSPSIDSCAGDLQCGPPTTRHTCSSSIPDAGNSWCCVPPGGRCNECDCCGDYYCSYDDNNIPTCVPNPEG